MILCAAPLTDSEPALVNPQPANTDIGRRTYKTRVDARQDVFDYTRDALQP